MLEGEKERLNVEASFDRGKSLEFPGQLIMTNYRVQFIPKNKRCSYMCKLSDKYFTIPLGVISNCDETIDKKNALTWIDIRTKDARRLRFVLSISGACPITSTVAKQIKGGAFVGSEKQCFAFTYKPFKEMNGGYDLLSELERMGIDENSPFRVYESQEFFKPDVSYPNKLVVPKSLRHEDVTAAAKYWQAKRFPVLTYYSKANGATLWRSASFTKVPFHE